MKYITRDRKDPLICRAQQMRSPLAGQVCCESSQTPTSPAHITTSRAPDVAVGHSPTGLFQPHRAQTGLALCAHTGDALRDTHGSPAPWHSCPSRGTVLIIAEKLS